MAPPPAAVKALATRLLAVEGAASDGSHADVAVQVWEKLRVSLTQLAGSEGFTSLLRRALALARADVPALQPVTLRTDGSQKVIDGLAADAEVGGPDAFVAITTHLLTLLVTFIGESLTLRLIRDAWPDTSIDD